jgi:hypothetical protein
MAPEFSRPLAVERIASTGTELTIEASAEEREALARRFDIPAVHAFSATFVATPWRRGGVQVRGEFAATSSRFRWCRSSPSHRKSANR